MRIKLILIIAFTLIAVKSKAQNETVNGNLTLNGVLNQVTNDDAIMTFNNTDDAWQYFQFKHSGVRKAWLGFDPSNNFRITKEQGGNILFMGSNVGINTTNPGARLDVNGVFRISNLDTDKKMQFLRTGGNVFSIEHDASRLYFYNSTTSKPLLAMSNGAHVGIGTVNPFSKMHVHEDGGAEMRLTGNGPSAYGELIFSSNNSGYKDYGASISGDGGGTGLNVGQLVFKTGYGEVRKERMRIISSGSIGIGTASPRAKLEIYDGDVRLTNARGIQFSDQYWEIGRNVVNTNGSTSLSSNKMQFVSYGNANEGYQFTDRIGNALFEIESSSGDAVFNKGKVGIGTTTPKSLLSIVKSNVGTNTDGLDSSLLYLNNGSDRDGSIVVKSHGTPENEVIGALKFHSTPDGANYSQSSIKAIAGKHTTANVLAFYTSASNIQREGEEVMRIQGSNVGIGTKTPDAKLAVNGTIHTKEVKVDLNGWSDFVFYNNYKLPTLEEVENHIKEKGHLKGIPSEKEVVENGIQLGEMNAKLLQKIEELTLYTIQQEKKIKQQEKEINALKHVSKRLEKIEKMLAKNN